MVVDKWSAWWFCTPHLQFSLEILFGESATLRAAVKTLKITKNHLQNLIAVSMYNKTMLCSF